MSALEDAVVRALGERMRAEPAFCHEVWSALANCEWTHTDGTAESCTWRSAAGLIAEIVSPDNDMEWYGKSKAGVISDDVADAMAREGWTGRPT